MRKEHQYHRHPGFAMQHSATTMQLVDRNDNEVSDRTQFLEFVQLLQQQERPQQQPQMSFCDHTPPLVRAPVPTTVLLPVQQIPFHITMQHFPIMPPRAVAHNSNFHNRHQPPWFLVDSSCNRAAAARLIDSDMNRAIQAPHNHDADKGPKITTTILQDFPTASSPGYIPNGNKNNYSKSKTNVTRDNSKTTTNQHTNNFHPRINNIDVAPTRIPAVMLQPQKNGCKPKPKASNRSPSLSISTMLQKQKQPTKPFCLPSSPNSVVETVKRVQEQKYGIFNDEISDGSDECQNGQISESSSKTSSSWKSPPPPQLLLKQREVVTQPTFSDVCFGLSSHKGTKEWRQVVSKFVNLEWSDWVYREVNCALKKKQTSLTLSGSSNNKHKSTVRPKAQVVRFLIYMDAEGFQLRKILNNDQGFWCVATAKEVANKTKELHRELRRNRKEEPAAVKKSAEQLITQVCGKMKRCRDVIAMAERDDNHNNGDDHQSVDETTGSQASKKPRSTHSVVDFVNLFTTFQAQLDNVSHISSKQSKIIEAAQHLDLLTEYVCREMQSELRIMQQQPQVDDIDIDHHETQSDGMDSEK